MSLKKLLVTIFSIIYLITTTGFTVNMHYCMGKLIKWAPWNVNADTCSNCGMEKSVAKDNGCCKEKHQHIKLKNDQKTGAIALKFIKLFSASPSLSLIELPCDILTSVTEETPVSDAAPPDSRIAVYIRNCVFLI